MIDIEINTELTRGTRIQIKDSKDKSLIGVIGTIRHNFPPDIWPNSPYDISLAIEKPFVDQVGNIYNLSKNDIYSPVFIEQNKDGFFIEGLCYISGQLYTESIEKIMKKFIACYDYDNKIYLFPSNEICSQCLKYILGAI